MHQGVLVETAAEQIHEPGHQTLARRSLEAVAMAPDNSLSDEGANRRLAHERVLFGEEPPEPGGGCLGILVEWVLQVRLKLRLARAGDSED